MVKPVKGGMNFFRGFWGQNKPTTKEELKAKLKKFLTNDILPDVKDNQVIVDKINSFNDIDQFNELLTDIKNKIYIAPADGTNNNESVSQGSPGQDAQPQQQPQPTSGGKRRKSLKKGKKKCKKTRGRR